MEGGGPVALVDDWIGEAEHVPGGLLCVRLDAGEGGAGQTRSADATEGERVRDAVWLQRSLPDQESRAGVSQCRNVGNHAHGDRAGRTVRQCSSAFRRGVDELIFRKSIWGKSA